MLKASFGSSRSTARLLARPTGLLKPLVQLCIRRMAGASQNADECRNFGDSGDWGWPYFPDALKLTTIVFSISMGTPLRRKGS